MIRARRIPHVSLLNQYTYPPVFCDNERPLWLRRFVLVYQPLFSSSILTEDEIFVLQSSVSSPLMALE